MTHRCRVSKEIVYTDKRAGEVLALVRAGFNVEWLDEGGRRVSRPAPEASSNGEATIERRKRRGRRRVNLTTQEREELVALRKKGCATRTLARKFKMSISGVRNALHRINKEKGGEPQ